MNGAVPADDDDEMDCPDDLAADDGEDVFEPESAVVVVIDAVPEVKAEPEVEAEAEVGNDEVGPDPALALAFASVTTKQSIVNSLGRVPSPTTMTWRVCCLFSRPLTLKNV